MSYMEDQIQRQYEAWMEQEREWYDLCEKLASEGWHRAKLNRQPSQSEINEMNEWLRKHYYGRYEYMNDEFMFPTEKDANWFLLRWS